MPFKINSSTSTFSVSRPALFPPTGWDHTMKLVKFKQGRAVQRGFDSVKKRFLLHNGVRVTAMLFSSGSVVVLGCKSMDDIRNGVDLVSQDLQSDIVKPVSISNVAGSTSYGGPINLVALHSYARSHSRLSQEYRVELEPELFPALIISSTDRESKKKGLVYHSGKIIITGVKSFNECNLFCDQIEEIIMEKDIEELIS